MIGSVAQGLGSPQGPEVKSCSHVDLPHWAEYTSPKACQKRGSLHSCLDGFVKATSIVQIWFAGLPDGKHGNTAATMECIRCIPSSRLFFAVFCTLHAGSRRMPSTSQSSLAAAPVPWGPAKLDLSDASWKACFPGARYMFLPLPF